VTSSNPFAEIQTETLPKSLEIRFVDAFYLFDSENERIGDGADMGDIVERQRAAPALLQIFSRHLIAAGLTY